MLIYPLDLTDGYVKLIQNVTPNDTHVQDMEHYAVCNVWCFHNFRASVVNLTANGIPVPNDFEVDITDPLLFAACDVSLPDMCKSTIDSAPGLIATPLMALLLAFVAKLVAF